MTNRGDYPSISNEPLTTPAQKPCVGRGSDLGYRIAFAEGCSHAMTLNDDTRISKGFVSALIDPRLPPDAEIVGPVIDRGFPNGP
jgi:GT2 family glycosyltransferase